MNKDFGKRKWEDEISPMEIDNPCKRLKLEDIIFCDNSANQETCTDEPIKNTAAKRRYKLLTAVHLKKKYKYYCKKHDVTYLIESVRKETKDLSKKRRDNFIQHFRDLSVSVNFKNFNEEKVNSDVDQDIHVPNIDMDIDVENRDKWHPDTTSTPNLTPLRSSTNSNLFFEESEDSNFKDNTENSSLLPVEIKNRFTAAVASFMDKTNFSDEDGDEDTDSSEDRCKCKHRKAKVIKCLIVTKHPGTNELSFRETDDLIESGIEDDTCDGNADCGCSDHENLRRRFPNFEYESSSDADDSDSYSNISEDD